jgi:hypothetical protein
MSRALREGHGFTEQETTLLETFRTPPPEEGALAVIQDGLEQGVAL